MLYTRKKLAVLWAVSLHEDIETLPIYMEEIGQMPILLHMIYNLYNADFRKIIIALDSESAILFQKNIINNILFINIKDEIELEILYVNDNLLNNLQHLLKRHSAEIVFLANANLPFIAQSFMDDASTVLNKPIDDMKVNLPALVLTNFKKINLNFLLNDNQNYIDYQSKFDNNHANMTNNALQIGLCFTHYGFFMTALEQLLAKSLKQESVKKHFVRHLISQIIDDNINIVYLEASDRDLFSIHIHENIAYAEVIFQEQQRKKFIKQGVRMLNYKSCFFSANCQIGDNVVIEPNVMIGRNVVIEDNCLIRTNSCIENTYIGANSTIGPFVNMSNNTIIGDHNHITSFVNIKNTTIGKKCTIQQFSTINSSKIGNNNVIWSSKISHSSNDREDFNIEHNCFLQNCIVYNKANIASESRILDFAVITDKVKENQVVFGDLKQKTRKIKNTEDLV